MKRVAEVRRNVRPHWVGDGFPVRSMFSYNDDATAFDPFLLLDYAEPYEFPPSGSRRGVGEHPHRGFETVTIVFQGELEHGDSAGNRGQIGPGDVQWMTAASGVVHEEFHSDAFTRNGGVFEVVQLWVNLPASQKMSPPRYQEIRARDIPQTTIEGGAGEVRVIAGEVAGAKGPAHTVTPIQLWDVSVKPGRTVSLPIPSGHNAIAMVRRGNANLVDSQRVAAGELAVFDREGDGIGIAAVGEEDFQAIVLAGEAIGESVVGQGPFVMNTRDEIRQAIADYQSGRMGTLD